jgi:hypothetical protein
MEIGNRDMNQAVCRWTRQMFSLNFMQCCGSGSVCFLGILDPDPLVRGTDPDPSVIKQKWLEKTLIPTVL